MMIKVSDWINHETKIQEKNSDGRLSSLDLNGHDEMGYDLTIKGIDVRSGGASLYSFNSTYVLKPGTCVVLETKEHVTTGNKVFGFICSRASLSANGLIVSNLKIDPNYSDTLYVTAFNASSTEVILKVGDPFCTVVFASNEKECDGEAVRPDTIGISDTPFDKVKKFLPHFLTYVGSVATAVLATWTILKGAPSP